MSDTAMRPVRPAQPHPGGALGAIHETMFGPPAAPDPAQVAAAARQAHRDELRDTLDVVQRFAVLGGLVALELLAAVLLLGVILAIY